jgi:hypothetical protein
MRSLAVRVVAVLSFAGTLAIAQPISNNNATAAADGGAVLLDSSPFEHLPAWLQLTGQIRGRFEGPSGTSLINKSPDDYYASRIRLGLGIKPVSWLRFFAEAQDARTGGYNSAPAPCTLYNPLDLRQGYVELSIERSSSVRFRAGRQELLFGGERLIGSADWGMSRTFDATDLGLSKGRAKVDFFAGSPVLIDPTRFDRHKPGEHVYGAYGSIRSVLPGLNVEPYVLFKQTLNVRSESGKSGDPLIVSPGARLFGKAQGRFDYTVEVVAQRGSYSADRVSALGSSFVAGWTFLPAAFKPRVSVEYNYASGDGSSNDGVHGTFDQFYPTNHIYYGMIDQFGWRNMKNARAGFDFAASRKTKIRADFNEFYLATVQDGLYNTLGTSVVVDRKATSGHIGSELSAVGLYKYSKVMSFGAGYGRLFAGEFLKESKVGYGYTYPYVMMVGNF